MAVDPRRGIFIPKKRVIRVIKSKEIDVSAAPQNPSITTIQPIDIDLLVDKIVNRLNNRVLVDTPQSGATITLPDIDNTIIDVGVDTPEIEKPTDISGSITTDQDQSFKKASSKLRKFKNK